MLKLENITKVYKNQFTALQDFTIEFQNGITGLLGANGAGKTTLMRIMATVMNPSGGQMIYDDFNVLKKPDQFRRILGYLPQEFNILPTLTPVEFLQYMASLKGIDRSASSERVDELLNTFNLYEFRNKRIGFFSGGMRQRVGLAQALLNDPKVLIIDEPTVGLDSYEKMNFNNLLSQLAENRIIILSTHIVSDLDNIATQIAVMKKGRLLCFSSPLDLLRQADKKIWRRFISMSQYEEFKNDHIVLSSSNQEMKCEVKYISEVEEDDSAAVGPSLEDAYIYATTRRVK